MSYFSHKAPPEKEKIVRSEDGADRQASRGGAKKKSKRASGGALNRNNNPAGGVPRWASRGNKRLVRATV